MISPLSGGGWCICEVLWVSVLMSEEETRMM